MSLGNAENPKPKSRHTNKLFMKKKYSKTLFMATIATSILCLTGLFNLSGCEENICGSFTVDDQVIDLTDPADPKKCLNVTISANDKFLPCREIPYSATVQGKFTFGKLSDVKWVADGDIVITDDTQNPVMIHGTKDGGSGFLKFVRSNGIILAIQHIDFSFADAIIMENSNVCINPNTKIGYGVLQLGGSALAVDDIVWSLKAGNADLTPDPNDKTKCKVDNVTGDFTVSVDVSVNNSCQSNATLTFPIKVPNCVGI